ncbi:MAG: DUF4430 domain-containing protein [Planctomycetota bacterium]
MYDQLASPQPHADQRLVLRHGSTSQGRCLAGTILILVSLLFGIGCDQTTQPPTTDPGTAGNQTTNLVNVRLMVSRTGQRNLKIDVECPENSTVFDVMEIAKSNGDLEFEHTGSGDTVFITSISGVANSGANQDNWIYRVNEVRGDCSCGEKQIASNDTIIWSYGKVSFD